jgi:acetyl-CoA C-acetyltransferase
MRESIRDKVSIVGVGCCQFGENWDKSPSDMIVDAAYEAYEDAGIEKPQEQIDAVFTGSIYSQKGPHECSDALKLWKPVTMVSNYCATGTDAFRCGLMSIAAGMYDTVLVVGYDKPKDRGVSGPSVMMNGVRDLPQTPAGWFSLCASTYFEKYGASREDLGRIAIKNHHNGTLAPKSFLKREITMDDYLKARMISWPFGLYDSAAQTDGAAAAIITRTDLVGNFRRDDPIRVKGVTVQAGPNPQKDPSNDFLSWKPTAWAAKEVYEQAGISDPRAQIDVAQVHDFFSLTELLTYEDLGLCEKGSAKEHIQDGAFELTGDLPVNTDGGLKTFGHPTGATGVRMIYENVLQLQGRADGRQVEGAEIALSHNIGGHPTACGIAILGKS